MSTALAMPNGVSDAEGLDDLGDQGNDLSIGISSGKAIKFSGRPIRHVGDGLEIFGLTFAQHKDVLECSKAMTELFLFQAYGCQR